jgi:hypothetical protein
MSLDNKTPYIVRPISLIIATCAGVLLVMAVLLRLYGLDLMEFKLDEIIALRQAEEIIKGNIPKTGLISSIGIPNPPHFLYILAIWRFFFPTPIAGVYFIAIGGLIAFFSLCFLAYKAGDRVALLLMLALGAASPWMVIYSRKIWAQNTLLPLVSILMLLLFELGKKPHSRVIAFILPLLALVTGIHFSTVCVVVSTLLYILMVPGPRKLNLKATLLGVLSALIIQSPYLDYLFETKFSDFSKATSSGSASNTFISVFLSSIKATGNVFFIGDSGSLIDFDQIHPVISNVASVLSNGAVYFVWTIVLVSLFTYAAARIRGGRAGEDSPQNAYPELLCILFIVMPPLIYGVAGAFPYNHYFIISIPALLLLASLVLAKILRSLSKLLLPGWALLAKSMFMIPVAVYLCVGAFWLSAFYRYIAENGGSRADYGEAFRFQEAAATYIAASSNNSTRLDYQWVRDSGVGINYLLEKMRIEQNATPRSPAQELTVINTLIVNQPCPAETVEKKYIGPYKLCRR